MDFPTFLEEAFLKWQHQQGKRKTLAEFADYLGVKPTTLSNWLSGKRKPDSESLRGLSSKLGMEIYDVLGMPRPDPDLAYINQNWDKVSDEFRRKFREEVEEHLSHEESQRVHKNRRVRTSS